MNQVDFSFFQTFVNIPAGTQITTFSVNFSEADDGSRLTIFNATYPDGLVVENSYTYLGGSQTADLSGHTAPGINRLLVSQLDDCPSGNNIGSALVVVNGSAIKTSQSINALSFSANSIETGASAQITATATSSLPVLLTSQTPAVCQVNGRSVTGVAAGTCTVSASQAGDSRFHPATSVSGSLSVVWPTAEGPPPPGDDAF